MTSGTVSTASTDGATLGPVRSLARTLRTVRHLKPVQVTNRVKRRLLPAKPRLAPPPGRRAATAATGPLGRPSSLLGQWRVRFLDIEAELAPGAAAWNDQRQSKLWLYNLHYFDGLLHPATPDQLKQSYIDRWLHENPPGAGNGWEPYPTSLRIVNWIKWGMLRGDIGPDAIASLAIQARFLADSLEYHLLGNHLWANGKALLFAGLFFEGAEAESWRALGSSILDAELEEQFLSDGGHFERSTTYQATMLEDVLDIVALESEAASPRLATWRDVAGRALAWLVVMTRPDGRVPLWNDAANDIAPTTQALLDYAQRLGVTPPSAPSLGLSRLDATGYYRWESRSWTAWADCGPIGPDYIPGHAHADIFNFELFANGVPLIVDTGISTYDVGPRRAFERSTAAHNTVGIAGGDQAELWGAFRVGRRPRIHDRRVGPTSLAAAHDGYRHLGVQHRRQFDFADDAIVIADTVTRTRSGLQAVSRLHFAPGVTPQLTGARVIAGSASIEFDGAQSAWFEACEIAEGFNRRSPAICLVVQFDQALRMAISPCAFSS